MAESVKLASPKKSEHKFQPGFLRIVPLANGAVGGLLVTNRQGRPLEFQCTTPVRPNKTQEILYGPTLESFLFSELIGKTLIERLNCPPDLLFVNQPQLLELRPLISIPLIGLGKMAKDSKVRLSGRPVLLHEEFADDESQFSQWDRLIPPAVDLEEPLERIQDALEETLRGAA